MSATCQRCGKQFRTEIGLGVHLAHLRRGGPARVNRICPDRRDDEEARDQALRIVRLKSRMGLLGRHP